MMTIRVQCPKCAAVLKVPQSMAGKRGKCPRCGALVAISAPAGATVKPPRLHSPAATGNKRSAAQYATGPNLVAEPAEAVTGPDGLASAAPRDQALEQQLDLAFRGEIKRLSKRPTYAIGAFLVTCVMVVLPLIYVGLIGLTAYGVYYHAVNHTGMLAYGRGRAKFFVVLAYVAPIVVGVIVVLFMIKPLFARPAHQVRTRSLTRRGEPLLFAFVERLCQIVGAPQPARIDVDYELNASASFRRGMLSFFGSDLVLTIGVPLVAGLSMRQFVFVLAHELGHFSQGVGMRLTYVARRINAWFARVVYERDEWDEWLAESAAEVDFRIGWILALSQLFVAISRGILWALMLVGHAVSGYMLRQMEYDADRLGTRVAGADVFPATMLRMRQLAAAYGLGQAEVLGFMTQGRAPDNLPKVMLNKLHDIPLKTRRSIRRAVEKEATGVFDTHPSDKDRIASVKQENAPGIFCCEGSAESLFSNFEALSKNVTWDLYCAIGLKVRPQDMEPVEKLTDPAQTVASPAPEEAPLPLD